jgi:galactokinase
VLPAAIDKEIIIGIAANQSNQCHVFSIDLNESHSFSVEELKPGKNWTHYLQGVMHGMRQIGFPLNGVDVTVCGNIPVGAGLSSSAALCCGFGMGYSQLMGFDLAKLAIAKIAQYAEHQFAGVKCGLMDQYASLFGERNRALLLDCKTLQHESVPFEFPEVDILLIDTKVKHTLADSAYNNRREACELGVALVMRKYDVKSLRDVSLAMLIELKDDFPDEVFQRCHYVVKELERTRQAAQHLKQHNLAAFGQLLHETHTGLSREYEVSCEESDYLVSLARDSEGVFGARMMGGGFGGCTINLVRKSETNQFIKWVKEKYTQTFQKDPGFYQMQITDGVSVIS